MNSIERALLVSALFIMGIVLPWWISAIFALYLASKVIAFELIPFGFLLDRLYGVAPSQFMGMALPFENLAYTFLLLFCVLFFLSIVVKRSLIFYVS